MIAAIMCGGRGTRMKSPEEEKALLKLRGRTMIEYVHAALAGSGKFEKIVAAVSPNTPKTENLLARLGVGIIKTAGRGYPEDLSLLLARLKPSRVFVVPADLPLLNSKVIGDIVAGASANQNNPRALSVMAEKSFVENIGVKPSVILQVDGKTCCHCGITIFDTSRISGNSEVKESYVVINKKEVAVNVNTKQELELAEKLLPP